MRGACLSVRVLARRPFTVLLAFLTALAGLLVATFYLGQRTALEQSDRQLDPHHAVFRLEGRMPIKEWRQYHFTELPGPLAAVIAAAADDRLVAISRYYEDREGQWRLASAEASGSEARAVRLGFADPAIARIIPFPRLLPSSAADVRLEPAGVWITEQTARRLFGTADALGRTLLLSGPATQRGALTVTAVLRDHDPLSHFQFDALVAIRPHLSPDLPPYPERWQSAGMEIFVRLARPADEKGATRLIRSLLHAAPEVEWSDGSRVRVSDFAIEARSLWGLDFFTPQGDGSPNPVKGHLALAGVFVWGLLALAIATSFWSHAASLLGRDRFLATLSLMGRSPAGHVAQLAIEAAVVWLGAAVAAMISHELLAPGLVDSGLLFVRGRLAPGLLLPVTAGAALLGGALFAMALTAQMKVAPLVLRLQPAFGGGGSVWGRHARSFLLFCQFAFMIFALYAALTFHRQWKILVDSDPGFSWKEIAVIENAYEAYGAREAFLAELRRLPGVVAVSQSEFAPPSAPTNVWKFRAPGSERRFELLMNPVDPEFARVFDVRMLAGRFFDPRHGGDLVADYRASRNVVITDAARRLLGFPDPQAAIGRQIAIDGAGRRPDVPVTIIGVASDMALQGMHKGFAPRIFFAVPGAGGKVALRIHTGDFRHIATLVQTVWNKFAPQAPFVFYPVSVRWQAAAHNEHRLALEVSLVVFVMAVLAVGGLIASAVLELRRRLREYALRKVLGASSWRLAGFAFMKLARPALVGIIAACPIAWLVLAGWLEQFPLRWTPSGIGDLMWPLVAAGGAIVLALSWHVLRAARLQPAEALRFE